MRIFRILENSVQIKDSDKIKKDSLTPLDAVKKFCKINNIKVFYDKILKS